MERGRRTPCADSLEKTGLVLDVGVAYAIGGVQPVVGSFLILLSFLLAPFTE